MAGLSDTVSVLIMRDPLNNLASRLKAAERRPDVFPVHERFLDLFEAYCAEYLGYTDELPKKTLVNFNRFVTESDYRQAMAEELGTHNHDAVSEVSPYGGGSSFSAGDRSPTPSLMTRYRQYPIPRHLLKLLLGRKSVREMCSTVFGYNLAERVSEVIAEERPEPH